MRTVTCDFQLITRCFSGGANAAAEAEIRVPAIRGHLRWWFRVLGGIDALAPKNLEDQEAEIFGMAAGNRGSASRLAIRLLPLSRRLPRSTTTMGMAAVRNNPDEAYLLWPMAQRIRDADGTQRENARAYLPVGTTFTIRVDWRGNPERWDDILALITVFGNLGALGYRGRRAQGALAFADTAPMTLADALGRFPSHSSRLTIRTLGKAPNCADAVKRLAAWLKGWREHGRSPNNLAIGSPRFAFALRDHHEGYETLTGKRLGAIEWVESGEIRRVEPGGHPGETFRSALGLPMVQRFNSLGGETCQWFPRYDDRGEGRFASPVILRPHLDDRGKWHPLVLFMDCYRWNPAEPVYLNGTSKGVSLDLYNAMKGATSTPYP